MIPQIYIDEWREHAPWVQDQMVEQDLIMSRLLVELFQDPILNQKIVFRGGTALHKLFFKPGYRYSEDIDLVQIEPGPIGEIFSLIKAIVQPILGTPQWKLKEGRAVLYYRFTATASDTLKLKLKIEINTREHFSVYPLSEMKFGMDNRWYSGSSMIKTYEFEELMATKLRALYQRKKGRDLFDIYLALKQPQFDLDKTIYAFQKYLEFQEQKVSRAMFESNLHEKFNSSVFQGDIIPLLPTGYNWDFRQASEDVQKTLISKLPGEPFKVKLQEEANEL